MKVAVLGLDNAGKTTAIARHLGVEGSIEPTFGYRIFTVPYKACRAEDESSRVTETKLTVMDIGGQSDFKKYWNNYFEDVDGIIFVVDLTDARPFREYLNEVLQQAVPTAIFANKADLTSENLQLDINADADVMIFRCSARSGEGLSEGFSWLLGHIAKLSLKGEYPKTVY